jgi:hypothetical protein
LINSFEDALKFQREQQDIVIRIGAYLSPIEDFLRKSEGNLAYAEDINNIRRLQPHLGDKSFIQQVNQFLSKYHYLAYYPAISGPEGEFAHHFAVQTLPSQKINVEKFVARIKQYCAIMKEGLIAIAQLPSPPIDINIKAQSSFQAYCFFIGLLSTVKDFFYLVDAYIDASIFYNYFYRLPNTTKIKIASSPDKWNRTIKEQIEALEPLFLSEYPNYSRKDVPDLHDRFLITETVAYQLGGSLKDAAKKSDFSVVQISEARRLELISQYFS